MENGEKDASLTNFQITAASLLHIANSILFIEENVAYQTGNNFCHSAFVNPVNSEMEKRVTSVSHGECF